MRKQNNGLRIVAGQILQSGDGASIKKYVLLIRLRSSIVPSLMGTLKSTLTTTWELLLRYFESCLRLTFLCIEFELNILKMHHILGFYIIYYIKAFDCLGKNWRMILKKVEEQGKRII